VNIGATEGYRTKGDKQCAENEVTGGRPKIQLKDVFGDSPSA
jgi:hypothetical protein